jgi:hypothetical protein
MLKIGHKVLLKQTSLGRVIVVECTRRQEIKRFAE